MILSHSNTLTNEQRVGFTNSLQYSGYVRNQGNREDNMNQQKAKEYAGKVF